MKNSLITLLCLLPNCAQAGPVATAHNDDVSGLGVVPFGQDYTLPPNTLAEGSVLRVRASFDVTDNSGGGSATCAIKVGDDIVVARGFLRVVVGYQVYLEVDLVIRGGNTAYASGKSWSSEGSSMEFNGFPLDSFSNGDSLVVSAVGILNNVGDRICMETFIVEVLGDSRP